MSDLAAKCSVCGSLCDEEDLFCANCGTEIPLREDRKIGRQDVARLTRCNFLCRGCGASMSYDPQAQSLRCPFCGSDDMQQEADAKILSPSQVIPFRLGRDEAVDAMRRWLGRGFWRPGDLAARAAVVEMMPVYVPYWVFRAKTHTFWTADTDQTPPGARGDWCPLSGEHQGEYAGLLVGASGALTAGETAAICPFDLAEGKPPDEVDLDRVTVERFSLGRKYARPIARQSIEQSEVQEVDRLYVPGRSRNVHVNVRVEAMSSQPVLLPVWIMTYRFRDRLYRFLVNGQSGTASGEAPSSVGKIALAAIALCIAAALIFLVCGGLLGH